MSFIPKIPFLTSLTAKPLKYEIDSGILQPYIEKMLTTLQKMESLVVLSEKPMSLSDFGDTGGKVLISFILKIFNGKLCYIKHLSYGNSLSKIIL